MKAAHLGTRFVIVVALVSSACAMEATEAGPDEVVVENESTPVEGSGERGGGSRCAPVIATDSSGNLYVAELLCPLPTKPSRDPERATLENLHGEWVSGGTTQNSVQ